MCSLCFVSREDSILCLVDSWDSTLQPQIVLGISWDAISCFATTFVVQVWAFLFARHGRCHRSFQFPPRILESFFVILVIRIKKFNSSQSSSIIEFWFFFCPFLLFSILSGFTNFFHTSGHTWSGLEVAWTFVNLHQDHMFPWWGFSFNRVKFVKPFHEYDRLLFESTF